LLRQPKCEGRSGLGAARFAAARRRDCRLYGHDLDRDDADEADLGLAISKRRRAEEGFPARLSHRPREMDQGVIRQAALGLAI
jgi:hypothetical protein